MIEEVRNGLFRIELPLPENPLKSLNAYLVRGAERHLLIDCGFNRPECLRALRNALESLRVKCCDLDVFLTHMHMDHCGLAGALVGNGARVWCDEAEGQGMNSFLSQAFWNETLDLMLYHGFTRPQRVALQASHPAILYGLSAPLAYTAVHDGQCFTYGDYHLRAVQVPGHTPRQLTLYAEHAGVYVSGDHLLGDITPNICRWSGVADSLGDYLRSLDVVAALPIEVALPGHRSIITNVPACIDRLKAHHARRLDETRAVLQREGASTALHIASRMTWALRYTSWSDVSVNQQWFACGETLAHLDHLAALGEVESCLADGLVRFWLKA